MSHLEAVIEIGSTGLRLVVAEVVEKDSWAVIDHSEFPALLGWDVFTSGTVSRDTLLQSLRILNRFKEQLAGWKIDPKQVTIIATSALREARNRDAVLDRIMVKTGFAVKIIDGVEENKLMYMAVLHALQGQTAKLKKLNSVIMEVGGGSTEIMLLERGKMAAVHSLRLGTVIIEQHIKSIMGSQKDARRFLEEFIQHTGVKLDTELKLDKVHQFITIGSDARLIARHIGTQLSESSWMITRKDFDSYVETLQEYSTEECIARFNISFSDARAMHINLLIYKLFINLTNAEEILVPNTSIRDGLIISKLSSPNISYKEDFLSQIIASALNLAKKYRIDEPHAQYVRKTALALFAQLQNELGFSSQQRMLLEVAAILHDVGVFIRSSDHQIHGHYIVSHSEIFGLNKEDMVIISNIVRYHRGPPPGLDDANFYMLSRADRMTVLKLSAILRIAEALDRSHSQRLTNFTVELRGDNLFLHIAGTHDIILEKKAVAEKSDLFETIFGYKVIL